MSNISNPSRRTESSSLRSSCEAGSDAMSAKIKCQSSAINDKECCVDGADTTDSRFSCNICFDEVVEPVVTKCGHLYCWPCLFQWLEPGLRPDERESLGMNPFRYGPINPSRRVCPVCKSDCPLSAVVPVFVRSASPSRKFRTKRGTDFVTVEEDAIHSPVMDNNEAENDETANIHESGVGVADEGLRRRRRRTNQISNHSTISGENSESIPVPNRPSVSRPQHQSEEPSSPPSSRRESPGSSPNNPYRVGAVQLTPRSPNGHNGSLTFGILSSLQRATAEYYRSNNSSADEPERRRIPSLHDRRNPQSNHNADGSGRFADSPQDYQYYDEGNGHLNSETTQYLTRLLIMLTSFVIFCFLAV